MGEQIEKDYLEEKEKKKLKKLNLSTEAQNQREQEMPNDHENKVPDSFDAIIKIKIFVIQNFGTVLGFIFMLLMAIYSENIE